MIVSAIVAVAENNVIGKDNSLIWRLPADMLFFKETTSGHHVITGRKNYLSIPPKFRPLPNRTNIVLTRANSLKEEGIVVAHSLQEAIDICAKNEETEAFVIGGGEIYRQSLENNLIDKLYLTKVHHSFDGDTFFPEIDSNEWVLLKSTFHDIDEKHSYAFTINVYQKKS